MNPNHYLAVAIRYLLTHRPQWPAHAAVGKTLVSSSMIDRVVQKLGRRLCEVPVGFKWFAPGLFDGSFCFGGEESAGASFLRRDGTVWTTDKDGLILDLLAAEITARTGKDPGEHYRELTAEFGTPYYTRIDAPATPEQKARLQKLSPEAVDGVELAGEPITAKLTRAPGNDAPIGGLKVVDRERLVRGPAVGHREHLQDLRGELQGPGPPGRDRERSPGDREERVGILEGTASERERRPERAELPPGSHDRSRRRQLQRVLPARPGMELLLFDREDDAGRRASFRLDPVANRTYHYWHVFVPGVRPGQLYGYRVHGPVRPGQRPALRPRQGPARPVRARRRRSRATAATPRAAGDNAATAMKSVVVDPARYDWEGDTPLRRPSARDRSSTRCTCAASRAIPAPASPRRPAARTPA